MADRQILMENILISGGSGLVGTAISHILKAKGYKVKWLSRNPSPNDLNIPEFYWDPDRGQIDKTALEETDAIINLAGASISKSWTPQYKSTILRSRVDATRLLFNTVQKNKTPLKAFISASAVGYYPTDPDKEFTEDDAPGNDFLSTVCQKWEQEAQNFEALNIRTVRMRIGIVLDKEQGALPQIVKPIKLGAGAPLGNGQQWMPWIHIKDLARQFVFVIENVEMQGAYNAVGTYSVKNNTLTKAAADVLHRPLIIPKVPSFALKLILGEMSEIVLTSNKCSNRKIAESGFNYEFTDLNEALKDLL